MAGLERKRRSCIGGSLLGMVIRRQRYSAWTISLLDGKNCEIARNFTKGGSGDMVKVV